VKGLSPRTTGGQSATAAERVVAVLGYHKIGQPPEEWWSWQYVPGDVFAAQIELLRGDGWEPIGAERFIAGLRAPQQLPPRSFLITFDDAYRSLRDDALDCLKGLGLPAVVFAPTRFVGGWNEFDHDVEPREEICDWSTLGELARQGVSIQSHGVSHRALSTLSPPDQERETTASKRTLEERLGSPVRLFAYPYGDPGDEEQLSGVLRRAGYEAAFGYGGGALRLPADNPYLLPRLAMGPDTDIPEELGL